MLLIFFFFVCIFQKKKVKIFIKKKIKKKKKKKKKKRRNLGILRWFWETNSLTFCVISNRTGGWCLILRILYHKKVICKEDWNLQPLILISQCLQQAQGMGQAIIALKFMRCWLANYFLLFKISAYSYRIKTRTNVIFEKALHNLVPSAWRGRALQALVFLIDNFDNEVFDCLKFIRKCVF